MRSIVVRTLSLLVIVGSLAASPKGIVLAWGVLYPDVEGAESERTFDAIVVLSGEDRRVERGLELAEAGKAPVLVVMYGEQWQGTRDQCGTKTNFETICPIPLEDSTRGEARLIGNLTRERNWTSILVVTGNYHVSRARLFIKRCVDDLVAVKFEAVNWDDLLLAVRRLEVGKAVWAHFINHEC